MTCPIDGRPLTNNATICTGCADTLDRALGDVDALLEDLDITLSRQSRKRSMVGINVASDGPPLPYDMGASKALDQLRGILVGWVRLTSEEREVPITCEYAAGSMASWLLHHVAWLTRHDAGPDAYSEVVGAVTNIRRTIDIAPDQTYIGPCYAVVEGVECSETLYGIDGSTTTRCRTCGTTWDARARTLEALAHAETVAQDATTLSRSFALKGIALETQRIKNWANRGHLLAVGTSHRSYPTYIVAHVARLVQLAEAGTKLSPWGTEQEPA